PSAYVNAIASAIDAALRAGAAVVVVAPPDHRRDDSEERALLAQMASSRFAGGGRVRYVDLGGDRRMYEHGLRLNGFDFSSAGIALAAQVIAPDVTALVRDAIR